jgi:pimeloyl-ACP methyl ester carboxylesterase
VVGTGQPSGEAAPSAGGGIALAYETFGRPADPPLLLIMGLGAQLLSWPEDFCRELVSRHLFVVRFDNRDVGLSSHLHTAPLPDMAAIMAGDPSSAPYSLSDMAADAAGLIEGLGLGSAHIVGASLGGTIAQVLAVEHPERVRSLTSIMSTTNDPTVGQWTEEAFAQLAVQAEPTREATIERDVRVNRVIGSPAFRTSEAELRDRAGRAFDRDVDPDGTTRQFAAFLASPDRTADLANVVAPTVVIHGAADPVIEVSGGRATAAAIPDAELFVIDGMGHDLPRQLWPRFADRISALVDRAEQHPAAMTELT